MFAKNLFTVIFLIFIHFFAGCGIFSGSTAGVEPTKTLDLDDGFDHSESVEKRDVLGLDMRIPEKSGYRVIGASFDPSMFQLERFLKYVEDGQPRAQYLFIVLADGTSDILIKMEPVEGGSVEIYKRVTVNVGEGGGLF